MARQPDPWKSLRDEFRKLQDQIRRMQAASPFFGTGVHPNGNQGLDSDNYVPATSGFSLDGGTGVAEFKDIILYDLPNSMLANPVMAAAAYDYTTNFALSTTLTNIRTKSIPVPAGFTTAAVTLTVRVYAINNTAGLDYLFSQANVNGYNGVALPVAASGSNGSAMNVSTFSVVLSDAALGSTLTLQVAAQTNFGGWAANASNAADLSASIAWYR